LHSCIWILYCWGTKWIVHTYSPEARLPPCPPTPFYLDRD
jgi:hypothetical protein